MLENVETKTNIVSYERKKRSMSNSNAQPSNQQTNSSQNGQQQPQEHNNIYFGRFLDNSGKILTIVVSLIAIVGIAINFSNRLTKNETEIESIKENLDRMGNDFDKDMQSVRSDISQMNDTLKNLEIQFAKNDNGGNIKKVRINDKNTSFASIINDDLVALSPKLDNEILIGTYVETGEDCYLSEVSNEPILAYYEENGCELFFLGKYNENGYWNGKCTLNVYKNSKLLTVFEGIYNDGELLSYKRISCDNENEWNVANRTFYDDYSDGQTWDYVKTSEINQEIKFDDFEESQIISYEKLKGDIENANSRLLKYYNGDISDGKYNDKSGQAYLVKYNDEGKIAILYKGKFKDGNFNDIDEGISWYISLGNEDKEHYFYYKGRFKNGVKMDKASITPLTQDEINAYVQNESFECPLNWIME